MADPALSNDGEHPELQGPIFEHPPKIEQGPTEPNTPVSERKEPSAIEYRPFNPTRLAKINTARSERQWEEAEEFLHRGEIDILGAANSLTVAREALRLARGSRERARRFQEVADSVSSFHRVKAKLKATADTYLDGVYPPVPKLMFWLVMIMIIFLIMYVAGVRITVSLG